MALIWIAPNLMGFETVTLSGKRLSLLFEPHSPNSIQRIISTGMYHYQYLSFWRKKGFTKANVQLGILEA